MKQINIFGGIVAFCLLLTISANAQQTPVLSLEECVDLALDNNILVRSATLSEQQAIQKKKEMFTSYFPTVAASGGIFDMNEHLVDIDMMGMPVQYIKSGSFAMLNATQPIFTGGRLINGNKLARVGVDVSKIQHEQSIDEVRLTAEQYYWNVVIMKNKLITIDALDTMLNRLLTDVTLAVKVGVKMQNDLLQVQLKQNEVESNRLKAENMLVTSRLLLAQYIGVDSVDVSADVDFNNLPLFPSELKKDHESALLGTTEYRLLEKNVESKRLDKRIEMGKHLPTVAVGAGLVTDNLLDKRQNLAAIYATVALPITDWWGGAHAIKRLKFAQEEAEEQKEDNAKLLLINMQNQWNTIEEAYKDLALAQRSITQSKENLRLNTDFYKVGTIPLSDLLQAQTLYQQAADGYVEALANYNLAITQYQIATSSVN